MDVRTASILKWSRAMETDSQGRPKVTEADWDRAHERTKGRLGEGLDKFEKGLKREQDREKDLDDLWRNTGRRED